MRKKIFIVDDEDVFRVSLADDLRDNGYAIYEYENPILALEEINRIRPDIVITDIKMPEMSGLEFLKEIKKNSTDSCVIVMTAFGAVDTAVQAMKDGAYEYIIKPFKLEELLIHIERILELRRIRNDYQTISEEIRAKYEIDRGVIASQKMQEVVKAIELVSKSNSSILITGETGTGKEFITNIIHNNSNRRGRPIIKVSCAVLSREVFESELFGHERGSFTGAIKDKKGRFELADGGTIYLDDVDDIPLEMQVKLLRVLEESEFERVGGTETIKIDVRVIASTKVDLKKLVSEGKFREDLYYRLNIFPIILYPLRERKEDISVLIEYYLNQFSNGKLNCDKESLEALTKYAWPGNVRELKNIMERLSLLCNEGMVTIDKLPSEIISGTRKKELSKIGTEPLDKLIADYEKEIIDRALQKFGGNKTKAAEFLQIPVSTLRSKIEKYVIAEDSKQ